MVNIDKEINAIIDILNKEYAYYKDILELSKSKRNIIVEGKVAELDNIVKLEQNIIISIGQLERNREEEVAGLCKLLELDSSQITISELSNMLKPELGNQLLDIQEKLQNTFRELKAVNDINGQLIEQSLEYIDYSINLIAGTGMETGSLYEDMGRNKNSQSKKNMFDTKV